MDWNTGNGIFKPGGYGGGIFDGNLSGLGSTMRNGILTPNKKPIRGIGAIAFDSADDYCWSAPGFSDCHDKAYKKAQTDCESRRQAAEAVKEDPSAYSLALKAYTDCLENSKRGYMSKDCSSICELYAAANSSSASVSSSECDSLSSGKFPYMTYAADTVKLQNCINKKAGSAVVTADGILGPKTCAAAKSNGVFVPGSCSGSTSVSKPVVTTPTVTQASIGGGGSTSKWLIVAAALGAGVFVAYKAGAFKKKR